MKVYLVSIYDVRFNNYHRPIIVDDIKSAVRSMHDAYTDPKHPLFLHPEDYDLHLIGWIEQDLETSELFIEKQKDVLLIGAEYIQQFKEAKHE